MRLRFLAAAALTVAVLSGVGIGWLVWGSSSRDGGQEASATLTAPPASPTPIAPGPLISISFGPQQVWNILEGPNSVQRLAALHDCAPQNTGWNDCILKAIQQNGGSRDAFDFFKLTGGFLQSLRGEGEVKLGTIAYPWRANENTQPILLGGDPPVFELENPQLSPPVENNPRFTILRSQRPNIMFWGSGPIPETGSVDSAGDQVFVFRYRLLDGCHACAVLGFARIELDFGPDGRLTGGPHLLNIVDN